MIMVKATVDIRDELLAQARAQAAREPLVSHIFRTTPATIGSQRGPVATAS